MAAASRSPYGRPLPAGPEPPAILAALALVPLSEVDPAEVERLLDLAFGADRRQRTAYRLRAGSTAIPAFSPAALDGDGRPIALAQAWPVALTGDDGTRHPLILLGPIAVRPDRQGTGLGRQVTTAALAAIDAAGHPATVLVGDPGYYTRFGFTAEATGGWRLPGPFERHRLLARLTGKAALPADGLLGPP